MIDQNRRDAALNHGMNRRTHQIQRFGPQELQQSRLELFLAPAKLEI
jgi:hypothetical protein